jgi:hypothetical protein
MDFENLVNFGVGLRQDIWHVAVVLKFGIRGKRFTQITPFLELARAVHHGVVLDGKSCWQITSLREFLSQARVT